MTPWRSWLPLVMLLPSCAGLLPDVTVDAKLPATLRAAPGQALVVFIRPPSPQGILVTIADTQGLIVTTLPAASLVPITVAPGTRDFIVLVSPKLAVLLRAELLPDRVYAAQVDVEMGLAGPGLAVHARRPAPGTALVTKEERAALKPLTPWEVWRAQNVFHDSWDAAALTRDATGDFDRLSADERHNRTLDGSDGVDEN